MTTFNQQGQQVRHQYNAGGTINFGGVHDRLALVHELEKLKTEVQKATNVQAIDAVVGAATEDQLTKAIQQTQEPVPDKTSILGHLYRAKALVEGVSAVGGMVTALMQAAQLVQRIL